MIKRTNAYTTKHRNDAKIMALPLVVIIHVAVAFTILALVEFGKCTSHYLHCYFCAILVCERCTERGVVTVMFT